MPILELTNGVILGDGHPVFIVAEIGLCHNGDVRKAKELIKKSAAAGANAVKFQKRDVDNLAVAEVLDAPDNRFPSFGKTYREIRRHVEFCIPVYKELQEYAESLGLVFFASVFDILSATQMAEIGCPAIKIASHCLTNKPLIAHLCTLKLPVLLSTGMAYFEEIDESVEILSRGGVPFGLYHCVSIYPHTSENANLKTIPLLQERYGVPVGYSNHEINNTTSALAVAIGACSIEKHVTLDNDDEGFDHSFALNMDGLASLVKDVRDAEAALGIGAKTVTDGEWLTRRKYHSSVVSTRVIKAGETIEQDMLTTKNPGEGIPARQIDEVCGRKAKVDIPADVPTSWDMLD